MKLYVLNEPNGTSNQTASIELMFSSMQFNELLIHDKIILVARQIGNGNHRIIYLKLDDELESVSWETIPY